MKAACIVPISALELVKGSSYSLALAHLALAVPDYANFYNEQRETKKFVILDNSAYELLQALNASSLLEAASKMQPSVLVIPDDIWDSAKNL